MIAAIERNGGVITTAYYDTNCLFALNDTEQFLRRGIVILEYLIIYFGDIVDTPESNIFCAYLYYSNDTFSN